MRLASSTAARAADNTAVTTKRLKANVATAEGVATLLAKDAFAINAGWRQAFLVGQMAMVAEKGTFAKQAADSTN
jgi:hypothetical protein